MKRLFRKNQIIITSLAIMIVIAGYLNFTADQTTPVNQTADGGDGDNVVVDAEVLSADNVYGDISEEDLQSEQELADVEVFPDEDLASVSAEAGSTGEETDIGAAETEGDELSAVIDSDGAEVSASAAAETDGLPDGENVGEAVLTSSSAASAFSASAKLNREQVRSKNEASLLEIINNTEISEDMKADAIASMNTLTDRAEKELAAELMLEAKGFTNSVVSINDDSVDVIIGSTEISDTQRAQIEDIVTRKTDAALADIVITTMGE